MGRITATAIHLSLCVAAGVGFALFVMPRWWELMGGTSHTLGTIIRIATGVLVALAALPVVLTLLRTRAPEAQTPAPALTLRMWSAGAHVVAGVLIIATAVTEIWVSLDTAGPWLYGVYGGALTTAFLGAAAFYLAFVAEKPPALPRAAKPKKDKKKRGKSAEASSDETATSDAGTTESQTESDSETETETETETESEDAETGAGDSETAASDTDESTDEPGEGDAPQVDESSDADADAEAEAPGILRNKRPSGKSGHRLRRSARTGGGTD